MVKIAFCDDDKQDVSIMRHYINEYSRWCEEEIEYTDFFSPIELMAEILKGGRYDILFMDVIMPGENGISIAREIRQYDTNVKIVFLTSSIEHAVDSYTVGAFYYQIKPIVKEKLFNILDQAISLLEKEKHRSMIVKCKSGITRVDIDQLIYCEVDRRTLLLHMEDGRVLELNGSMDYLSGQLSAYENFLRPHRSYLINMDKIDTITGKCIIMRNKSEIPVPHGKLSEIKNAYLKYAFSTSQILI
ncbi:MAG: response regulator transcription factor [Lachnospiraceae bacterium]|nr:response regulator transcription factor [Lachnospiraceae bacterium]